MKTQHIFLCLAIILTMGNSLHAKNLMHFEEVPEVVNEKGEIVATTNIAAISATISGSTTVCQNDTSPTITFTGTGGTAPYTFSYRINNGAVQTIATTDISNTVTIAANITGAFDVFYYLDSVHDDLNPSIEQATPASVKITVLPQPDASLNSSAVANIYNGFPVFKVCTTSSSTIDFINSSTTKANNASYTISWGDNSPDFTATDFSTTNHKFEVGLWTMIYTIKGENGCAISKTYKVFVGNNPAVGLSNPGNTDVCITSSLRFPITGTENNPPGTTYLVSFNDGSPPVRFDHPPPSYVDHQFIRTSCGTTSVVGATYYNSFFASITAENPCDQSFAAVVPIRIAAAPVANFSSPQRVNCVNTRICINNTSTEGDIDLALSCSGPKVIWKISPSTGFTITEGDLGNDFGSADPTSWATGLSDICPTFTAPGIYTVTMKIGNRCGTDEITKTICIESPLVPQFTLNNNAGCGPVTVSTTNTTSEENVCQPPVYVWTVAYSAGDCGSTIEPFPDQIAKNTSFNFTIPGFYTVKLTVTNSCGSFSTEKIVEVKKPPTASIAAIANLCGAGEISPTATILSCTKSNSPLIYAWSFPGGIPATANTANPGKIRYDTTGTYTVSLVVSNECGDSEISQQDFTIINSAPQVENLITSICSSNSFLVNPVTIGGEAVPLGTTYIWSNPVVSPANSVTGATAQTTPQLNISQNLINISSSNATVTYTVTPQAGSCDGSTFTVIVTVFPEIKVVETLIDAKCFAVNDASISTVVSGGKPFTTGNPYLYSWTGPNGFTAASSSISNLEPGIYKLAIADSGNCPFTKEYVISDPSAIVITLNAKKDVSCFNDSNGSIDIDVSGGKPNYYYTWTKNGSPFATTQDLDNLAAGIYEVTVRDSNNCSPEKVAFTIVQAPLLTVNELSKIDVECFGYATGAISVNVSGGTSVANDYKFLWSGPNGFTSNVPNLVNLVAGTYTLNVTDNLGCTAALVVTILQPSEIKIDYSITSISCYGNENGSITASISGGTAPYKYQWSNLATNLNQNNLGAGNYVLQVTDDKGCQKLETIIIPEAPIFKVTPTKKDVSCYGAQDGNIVLNLEGGKAPVTLVWSDGSTAGVTRNNLGPGTYTATISDGSPCQIVKKFVIIEPQPFLLAANLTNPINCEEVFDGAINLLISGGTAPYSYLWSNGATTKNLSNLAAGNYAIVVTDAKGCTKEAEYTITRPLPLITKVETKTIYNCDTKDVKQTFVATVSGGYPPYQYNWSSGFVSGANNEIMNTSQNGLVLLNVTDKIGCQSSYSFNVDLPKLGGSSFTTNSFSYKTYGFYSITDPIQFTNTATSDYVSLTWDFGDGTYSTEENPVHTYVISKDYVVTQTVTYALGCVEVSKISLFATRGYILVLPTAFTPNSDGYNDTYRPVTKTLKNIRLDVYDTWGSLLYSESGDVLVGWDGTIKGVKAENGNYFARVSAETFYGVIVSENTPFTLIK